MIDVPRGWELASIGDVHTYYSGGDNFEKLEYQSFGIPVLAKGDVKPFGRVEHSGSRYIDPARVVEKDYRVTQPGDLLLTTRDLTLAADFLGLLAPVPEDRQFLVNQGANILRTNNLVDQRYLVYWCNGPIYRAHIKSHYVGSTQIHLRKGDFLQAPLLLPPIEEQRAIAGILGALDDKIELNRRTNQTLEAIARAIFKSWFVDFDPVRARMDGRQPFGMDAATAALFPSSFDDSPIGPTPTGWHVGPLSKHIEILSGGTPSTSVPNYWNGPIPWVSVADAAPGPYIIATEKAITQAGVANSPAKILPVNTLVISARGTVGNCALMAVPMAMNQSCYGLTGTDGVGPIFLLHLVRDQVSRLRASAHGSVFDTITRATFSSIDVVWPSAPLLATYEAQVAAIFSQILAKARESQTLATTRDYLLPKLLSGQLRVNHAERLVGAAL